MEEMKGDCFFFKKFIILTSNKSKGEMDEKRLDEKTVNSLKTMLTKSLPQRVRKKINVTYNDRTGRFSGKKKYENLK